MLTADATRKTVTVDGHDLAYHDVGDGPPVVFLHGSGPGVTGWANFGENLSRRHRQATVAVAHHVRIRTQSHHIIDVGPIRTPKNQALGFEIPYLVVQVCEGQLLRLDLEVDALRSRGS